MITHLIGFSLVASGVVALITAPLAALADTEADTEEET